MREPRSFTYFVDRNIDSPTFVDPLVRAGFHVERFSRQPGLDPIEDSDELWIRMAAEKGWIGLSCNWRIGSVPEELDTVMRSGMALFVLVFGRRTNHAILAENFLRTAEKIAAFREKHEPPFIAKVSRPNEEGWLAGRPGRIRMFRSHSDWLRNQHRRRTR